MIDPKLVIVDARAFGAKGDGINDDAPCVQAAIDYCFSMGGGTVLLCGMLYFMQTVYLKPGVNLIGIGGAIYQGCYIFVPRGNKTAIKIIDANTCCRIENIGIGGDIDYVDCIGIQLGDEESEPKKSVNYISIRDVWFNLCKIGIKVDYAFDVLLERVLFANGHDGLYVSQGSQVKAISCCFMNNTNYQLHLKGGGGCDFDMCAFGARPNVQNPVWSKYAVYMERYIPSGESNIIAGISHVFKSCRFEGNGWQDGQGGHHEDTSQVYVDSSDNASFESCHFTNSGSLIHAQVVNSKYVKFRGCSHCKHYLREDTFYAIGSDCEGTFIEQPYGINIYSDTDYRPIPPDLVMANNIGDQGKGTIIEIPGLPILPIEVSIGGAAAVAGAAANLMTASLIFDDASWSATHAILTKVPVEDYYVYTLQREPGYEEGYLEKTVTIPEEDQAPYFFAVGMAAYAMTFRVALWAQYVGDAPQYRNEFNVDSPGNIY